MISQHNTEVGASCPGSFVTVGAVLVHVLYSTRNSLLYRHTGKKGTTLFQETVVQGNLFLSSAIIMAKKILSIVKKKGIKMFLNRERSYR